MTSSEWPHGRPDDLAEKIGRVYAPPEMAKISDLGTAASWPEASEALSLHTSLSHWFGTRSHQFLTEMFVDAYFRADANSGITPSQFMHDESTWVKRMPTIYVDPDVAETIEHLAESMPPDMLRASDLPSPNGFLVLGRPWGYWVYENYEGEYSFREPSPDIPSVAQVPIRAVAWRTVDHVGNRHPVTGEREYKEGIQFLVYVDSEWLCRAYPHIHDVAGSRPPAVLHDMLAWSFDTGWRDAGEDEEVSHDRQAPHVGALRRKLLALFRFMSEEIVHSARERMPRATMRRWGRVGETPEDGAILTVRLRRYHKDGAPAAPQDTLSGAREWTHRWWVTGHPRMNPKTGVKDIWVRPYLKGPNGLPIVIKNRIIAVDR